MSRPAPGPRLLFVAGTDTGAGKTLVTGLLARALCAAGRDVAVVKAVQTGCEERAGKIISPDLESVADTAGWDRDDPRLFLGAGFRPACSPHLASVLEGRPLDLPACEVVIRAAMERHAHVLVEGAGGLLVPLRDDLLFADWIATWNAPVLLVARAGLGTINHTLLSAEALRRRGIPLSGMVLNDLPPGGPDWIVADNAAYLARALAVPVTVLPPHPDAASAAAVLRLFANHAAG